MRELGFPSGSDGKESAYSAGDLGSVPELGSSPGGEHGNPSILAWRTPQTEAWQATVHGSQRVGHNRAPKHTAQGLDGLNSLSSCVTSVSGKT